LNHLVYIYISKSHKPVFLTVALSCISKQLRIE